MQILLPPRFQRAYLEALDEADTRYCSQLSLCAFDYQSPGYHTTLRRGKVHRIVDSLWYAIGLADAGRPGDWERAQAIVERVLDFQDVRDQSRYRGTWPWFAEEPVDQMNPPDMNYADFCSVALLDLLLGDGERLDPSLRLRMEEALRNAVEAIMRRNVKPDYTNIAIMGGYAALAAGEYLGDASYLDYGRQRLGRSVTHFREQGGFAEFNSPAYTCIALLDTARILLYVKDVEGREYGAALHQRLWEELAMHYHPPSGQLSGPHSRAYPIFLSPATRSLFDRALEGAMAVEPCIITLPEQRLPVRCPESLSAAFLGQELPRMTSQRYLDRKPPVIGNTYLHPDYALGSVTFGYSFWNQCRPLIAYWGQSDAPTALRLRLLKDGEDLATGQIHSTQDNGDVLSAITFNTAQGISHPSLDPIPESGILLSDLRLSLDLYQAGPFQVLHASNDGFRIVFENLTVAVDGFGVDVLGQKVDWSPMTTSANEPFTGTVVSIVLYSGPQRTVDRDELMHIFAAISLRIQTGENAAGARPLRIVWNGEHCLQAGDLRLPAALHQTPS